MAPHRQENDPIRHAVLIHRRFLTFTGGHLRFWQYYNHILQSPNHHPYIYFSDDSIWDESNPWLGVRGEALASWDAVKPDILLLGGRDWEMLGDAQRTTSSVPIINLILGVKHAQPEYPHFAFLKHKAIRICNSEQVKTAITETGQVNGPVFVIPGCMDLQALPDPLDRAEKNIDILIAAMKQPEIGFALMKRLKEPGRRIEILTNRMLRPEYLDRVNDAKLTICLPNPSEGFYRPALEGMALGTIVVCPDCVGNRSFCLPKHNCFRPEFDLESIVEAATAALQLTPSDMHQMLANAKTTAANHDLIAERTAFLDILDNVNHIW